MSTPLASILSDTTAAIELDTYQRQFPELSIEAYLLISSGLQKLFLVQEKKVLSEYVISTATAGLGSDSGSFKTPLGMHKIQEKIGQGAKMGAVFKTRKNTHQLAKILTNPRSSSDADNITSRILWLSGLEKGRNEGYDEQGKLVDTHQRYIYIHGTDEEGKLGSASSHGCIRMANTDVIELFDNVAEGCLVLIIE